ncbi:MAG: hypothetical protein ACMUHX_04800 [bacterium]
MKRLLFLILITAFIIAKIFLVKASADSNGGPDSGSQNVTLTGSAADYFSGPDAIQTDDNEISVEMNLPSGWSMISLPILPSSVSVSSLFPEAKTVFGYEKGEGYVHITASEELKAGKGYWILLDQNQSYTLFGQPIQSYTKTAYEHGWEMIGGCSYSAKASTNGCNIGVIYDYVQGAGYTRIPRPERLDPGKGYWILLRDLTCQPSPNAGLTNMDAYFGEIASMMNYALVTSGLVPNYQEKITFITVDIYGQKKVLSEGQEPILTFMEMTSEQRNAYNDFASISKTKINQTRRIGINDNELLFPEDKRDLYNSPYLEEISSASLPLLCGNDCPFEYREYRKSQRDMILISSSRMTLKSNKLITLKEGLYFFEELILEENSLINTDGAVSIYVKKLELEKNARLMGGESTNPDECQPNNLIILAQRWDGAYYNPEDGVKIGPAATVCGHIFAPDLKVIICKGYNGKATRVYGSILTHQLITLGCDAGVSFGPIWIIYDEYIEYSKCDFELKVNN